MSVQCTAVTGVTPGSALTSGGFQGSYWMLGDQTPVSHVQDKCSTCCAITLALSTFFLSAHHVPFENFCFYDFYKQATLKFVDSSFSFW